MVSAFNGASLQRVAHGSLLRIKNDKPKRKEMTTMKTLITSQNSLLTILRSRSASILVVLTLGAFAVAHDGHAVSPPPDGGYPGGNTAEGQSAVLSLTSGTFNTAIGFLSLSGLKEGNFNTGLGAGTLLFNVADENTATGAGALLSNTTGNPNTANGAFALFLNTEGTFNTATGDRVLFSNTSGSANSAFGSGALASNTVGFNNTANGMAALSHNTTGRDNTANGVQALNSNTTGGGNTANGDIALFNNTTGGDNTADGTGALQNNTTGGANTALGAGAGLGVFTASHVIAIGTNGADVSDSCFIGNIRGVRTANADAISVVIDSAGQLGTLSSSRRFKKEIKPMDKTSEAIFALRPVAFHYKNDKTSMPQFGLIAEEVAEVNPDLVVRDDQGEIYTVRYEAVNAMLLNEFLKEHKKVEAEHSQIEKQEATITELKSNLAEQHKQIQALTAGLQKVSAHVGVSAPAAKVVANGQPAEKRRNDKYESAD